MKKQVTILLTAFFLLFVMGEASFAQKTTEKTKEAEELIKQAEKERIRVDELYKRQMIDAGTRREEMKAIDENFSEFFDISTDVSHTNPGQYITIMSGSQNSETLEYRKTVKESSFTKEVPFDVDPNVSRASIAISGSCKEGEIRIKILMPDGKAYTEVLLDEYGTVNWNKSFSIEEDDNSRTGKWKFVISAKEASGNFRVSIKSY